MLIVGLYSEVDSTLAQSTLGALKYSDNITEIRTSEKSFPVSLVEKFSQMGQVEKMYMDGTTGDLYLAPVTARADKNRDLLLALAQYSSIPSNRLFASKATQKGLIPNSIFILSHTTPHHVVSSYATMLGYSAFSFLDLHGSTNYLQQHRSDWFFIVAIVGLLPLLLGCLTFTTKKFLLEFGLPQLSFPLSWPTGTITRVICQLVVYPLVFTTGLSLAIYSLVAYIFKQRSGIYIGMQATTIYAVLFVGLGVSLFAGIYVLLNCYRGSKNVIRFING